MADENTGGGNEGANNTGGAQGGAGEGSNGGAQNGAGEGSKTDAGAQNDAAKKDAGTAAEGEAGDKANPPAPGDEPRTFRPTDEIQKEVDEDGKVTEKQSRASAGENTSDGVTGAPDGVGADLENGQGQKAPVDLVAEGEETEVETKTKTTQSRKKKR